MKYIRYLILLYGILTLTQNIIAKNLVDGNSAFIDLVVGVKNKQTNASPQMQTVRIHYRVNRIVIERDYMGNAEAFEMLNRIFAEHPADEIAYIVITGTASPEGPPRNNEWLSEQRAAALKNYILDNYPGFYDDQIITIARGEDWSGLETMIKKDMKVPYRNELLRILQNNRISREEQKRRMAALGGGQAYKYLQSYILPYLRGGVSSMIYFRDKPTADTIEIVRIDTVYIERTPLLPQGNTDTDKKKKKPFYIAIKTNLLYDAALLPNLAVEVPFGKNYRWSVAAEGNWSWWDTGANNYNYHRIQMAGVELRRWFEYKTRRPLNGLYVGAYAYGGTYDVRLFAKKDTDKGQLSDLSYSAGLSLGYVIPIGWRWNLEFGIAAGYFGGKYKKYNHSTCEDGTFPWLSSHNRNYFGLTKANISIVWVIGK